MPGLSLWRARSVSVASARPLTVRRAYVRLPRHSRARTMVVGLADTSLTVQATVVVADFLGLQSTLALCPAGPWGPAAPLSPFAPASPLLPGSPLAPAG